MWFHQTLISDTFQAFATLTFEGLECCKRCPPLSALASAMWEAERDVDTRLRQEKPDRGTASHTNGVRTCNSLLGSNLRRFFQEGSGRCISYLVLPPHCGRRLSYEFLGALNAVRVQSVSLGWNLQHQLYYDFPGARFECLQRLDLQCDSLPEIGML